MDDLKEYRVTVVLKCQFSFKTALPEESIQHHVAKTLEVVIESHLDGISDIDGPCSCDVEVEEK